MDEWKVGQRGTPERVFLDESKAFRAATDQTSAVNPAYVVTPDDRILYVIPRSLGWRIHIVREV